MKKILLAIALFIIMGCNTDKPDPIIGTWALVDIIAYRPITGEKLSAAADIKTWTFHESGSAYVNGSTPMTYTIDGKYLSLTYVNSGRTITYEIVELTESTLKVYSFTPPNQYQDGVELWFTFTKMP